jgi:hypothetical protein
MVITVAEAGRKGGLRTLSLKGRGFFSSIGREGQRALRSKYPGMASIWGKRGGRPKKSALYSTGGGVVKNKKEMRTRLRPSLPLP